MNSEKPDIAYFFPTNYSQEIVKEEITEITHNKIKIYLHQNQDSPIFNAFEWAIPTGFVVYVLKPYFEAFLSEAGKDHYVLFKKFIHKFLEKGKQYDFSIIAASQSTEKLSKKYNKSFAISIELQSKNNRVIKVLFDNSLTIDD